MKTHTSYNLPNKPMVRFFNVEDSEEEIHRVYGTDLVPTIGTTIEFGDSDSIRYNVVKVLWMPHVPHNEQQGYWMIEVSLMTC